ncbi:MAG TPA: MaoC family dehydratase [Stellaceae bacterium]|jgi:acyl dehydratase|nr:MaoC family dehydratase [Stellaceae bacterium]
MAGRYLEDFHPGEVIELGSRTVSAEEIIAFARQFDPQYFHIDPERAKASPFGGLIASGWHTVAMYMRLVVDRFISGMAESMGSPGVDGIRWLKPVRPGDTLMGRSTVVEIIPSKSRADRGTLKSLGELVNQHGEVVMQMNSVGFFARRPK